MEWMDATFWAFVALVIFIGVLLYFGVPKLVANALDARIAKIRQDLEEARRLREEAQHLLADYERKRQSAQAEADDIIAAARDDAARLTTEANIALENLVTRRTRAVEDRIAQAEAQALAEVRARSADMAVEAAKVLLRQQMPSKGDLLVNQAIQDVAARMN